MTVVDTTVHEMWLAVARAAAEHRRVTSAGEELFYGDPTLRDSAHARAWGELARAIRAAKVVAKEEVVDSLCSGDPRLDVLEAGELIAWVRSSDERLRELGQHFLGDLLGEE